jgi:hypothetical protein
VQGTRGHRVTHWEWHSGRVCGITIKGSKQQAGHKACQRLQAAGECIQACSAKSPVHLSRVLLCVWPQLQPPCEHKRAHLHLRLLLTYQVLSRSEPPLPLRPHC